MAYKLAVFNSKTYSGNLQQALKKALGPEKAAYDRRMETNDDGDEFRFVNYNTSFKNILVGDFHDYTEGAHQPVFKIDKKASHLEMSALETPENSEYVGAIMYFGVLGNHIALVQSTGLRSLQLEEYFNWLLRKNNILGDDDWVGIQDPLPKDLTERIGNTSKITFSSPVSFVPSEAGTAGKSGSSISKYMPKGRAWEFLKNYMPEFCIPDSVGADEIVDNQHLKVKVVLSWSRQGKDDPTEFFDSIARNFSHVDKEVLFQIESKNGSKITNDDFKLSKKAILKASAETKLIDTSSLWPKMREWFQDLNRDRIISDIP